MENGVLVELSSVTAAQSAKDSLMRDTWHPVWSALLVRHTAIVLHRTL